MARIRSVKPEFWIDEKVVELSPWARLLFVGLWNFADDQGYVDDKPRRIKMQVFPGDDVDLEALLGELTGAGLLVRYQSPVGPVLHVRNWDKHQKVDRPSAARFDPNDLVLVPAREPSTRAIEDSTASLDAEGKGSGRDLDLDLDLEGIGEPASRPPASRSAANGNAPLSMTQRSKKITDAYSAVEPMSKWPAVNGVVLKAIKAERWSDDEIQAALMRLAREKRSVTVETLRVELDGLTPSVRGSPYVEHNGLRLRPETAANVQARARWEAADRAAIEGPT